MRLKAAAFLFLLLSLSAVLIWLTFPLSHGLRLAPVAWDELPGLEGDTLDGFSQAYLQSCARLQSLPSNAPMPVGPYALTRADWQNACAQVEADGGDFKAALRRAYQPFALYEGRKQFGHFTGYYVPLLKGSHTPSPEYPIPLYRRPLELVDVDLGAFRPSLKGQRIAGLVQGKRLIPFSDRAAIDAGALDGKGLELLWVSSAVDAFFLHIQGSGHVQLENGDVVRVGYDGQNGHPYYAIGRTLIAEGEVARKDMSLEAITHWLEDNPDRAEALMQENASFIFFRLLEGDGVIGAQGVPLTPGRSLAVDPRVIPLGAPVWIATEVGDAQPLRRLMMAQDTGGAIAGIGRGDIFFGPGEEAKRLAGALNVKGRMMVLLPRQGLPAS